MRYPFHEKLFDEILFGKTPFDEMPRGTASHLCAIFCDAGL
jgi:hypothetical protein